MAVIDHRLEKTGSGDWSQFVGLWADIPSEKYHGDLLGVTKGDLDQLRFSFNHFVQRRTTPPPVTPAMAFGSMFHQLVLEPDEFERNYISDSPIVGIDRRTRAGKEAYESFLAYADGKTVVKEEDWNKARAMCDSILGHPTACEILSSGKAEQTAVWLDSETNIICKARPDFLRSDHVIVDLKTAERADYVGFQRAVVNYNYHVQYAHYAMGLEKVLGHPHTFIFIVIEKSPPYPVAIYSLDSIAFDVGKMFVREQLSKLAEYYKMLDSGRPVYEWGSYPTEIQEMRLPAWA